MNSIESNFVPYQIALDMKSIGFDEPCFGKFYYDQLEIGGNWCNDDFKEDLDIYISAPTFSQAFRWFRERYKIRFFIQSGMSDLGEFFKVIFPDGEQRNMSYITYEEAELECLKKLIQIIKEKT
jgi:hypothetical protein